MTAIIHADNGGPVKLRQSNDPKRSGYSIWEEIPSGTKAEVLKSGETWSRIRVGSRTGWMMSKFLVADDSVLPAEPELADGVQTAEQGDCTDCSVSDRNRGPVPDVLLSEIYSVLHDLCDKIERTIGEG